MSAHVQSLSVTQAVEYIGGTASREVAVVHVVTISGVYFETRIPRKAYVASFAREQAELISAVVEAIVGDPNVAGLQWSQEANPAGYLLDVGTIYVTSDSGDSSLAFTVPWGQLTAGVHSPQIGPLIAQLNATEANA